jgi:2-C-methyl-D-erythritol 2,4-cyclodiphosphate synthase
MTSRVGLGFDVHRLKPGRGLRIGGIDVSCEFAFVAHSDGDPLLHALVDALLGAAGRGDIGEHFPDTDPRWKDADSRTFVETVRNIVGQTGLSIANVDANVILERPKLGKLKDVMRRSIADLLRIDAERVNVKARTFEGLGPIGAGEAVAAQVVVLLVKS